jgi:serine/threonine-protein kinase
MALETGEAFGNFRIVKLIGEGGFGEVYLAENPLIKRRAAVKVLLPELARSSEVVGRFLNEARAASAIRHPNIVEVFDAGATSEGAPYILMEFLEGEPLQRRFAQQGRLDVHQAMAIAQQAGSALAAAHEAGIVHRDLKPENLFLVLDKQAPGGELLKILDFGIAKIMSGEGAVDSFKTRAGLIMGSPAYMSPEQCMDTGQVDLRTDIYSLAVILYEALAGRPPHESESGTSLMLMHLSVDPVRLGELCPEVPAHIEAAIMRALAREPADRFQDMPSFMGALRGEQQPTRRGMAPLDDRPSAKIGPRREATAILSSDSKPAQMKGAQGRGGIRSSRPGNTTLSRSIGETSTLADGVVPRDRRFSRMVVAAVGVVVLGGVALTVALVRRGGSASADHRPSASIVQPSGPQEPSVKPPQLVAPQGSLPPAAPAVAPPPPVAEAPTPPLKPTSSTKAKDASKRSRPSISPRAPEALPKPPAAVPTVIKRQVF